MNDDLRIKKPFPFLSLKDIYFFSSFFILEEKLELAIWVFHFLLKGTFLAWRILLMTLTLAVQKEDSVSEFIRIAFQEEKTEALSSRYLSLSTPYFGFTVFL